MYPLLLLVPLLAGGTLALLLGASSSSQRYSKYAAIAGSAASSALVLYAILFQPATQPSSLQWFTFGSYTFTLYFSLSSINWLLLLLLSIITPLIFWYSAGYMNVPSEQARYYFELSLFAASMLLFAMSADFITLFIAWVGLGITSYLLIGFWYHRSNPPYAARKAITTIIIGDVFMLAGMLVIWNHYHTFTFSAIMSYLSGSSASAVPAALSVGLAFVLLGAFTKSAQFPFHEWLSDAMEGPTPVSAFLHSSTMVKAGVFLIALLLPLYEAAGLLNVILVIGIITTVLGALNALSSRHLKKILAYSTIEDLGIMFIALGLNALPAALLLFTVQTFYKALLFMSAGTIMKANSDEVDIYRVKAFGRSRAIFIMALVGALSIAGIFPFSGFLGKASADAAASSNLPVYVVLTIVDFLTAMYIFRWLFVPMRQQAESQSREVSTGYAATSINMTAPQVVLAVFVIGMTAVIMLLPSRLPSYSAGLSGAAVESAAALTGVAAAYAIFKRAKSSVFSEKSKLRVFLSKGFFVNSAYDYAAIAAMLAAGAVDTFDRGLDRFLYHGGAGIIGLGNAIRKAENGSVNVYLAALAIGLIFIIAILVL